MARRGGEFIELSGPLFDPDISARFEEAIGEGIEELGELGADILTQFDASASFIDTGQFIGSIESEYRGRKGEAGYAIVRPTDVWPKADRPPRTWFETGMRRGVKLRKANTGFRRTTTRLKQVGLGPVFEDRITRVLN